jgi:hypothetical protein
MFGGTGAEREFLQYVRAGIRGYLLLGASVKGMGGIGSSACRESILSKYALRIVVQLF